MWKSEELNHRPDPENMWKSEELNHRPDSENMWKREELNHRPDPENMWKSEELNHRPDPENMWKSEELNHRPDPENMWKSEELNHRPDSENMWKSEELNHRPDSENMWKSEELNHRPDSENMWKIAVHVAGSKLETTEGHSVSMHFKTGLERVDEVRIIFEGESKRKLLLSQYCSPASVPICDPIETPHHLQVEGGNVSMILLKVNISSSGLYTARVITDNRVSEVTATLVVNQAPVSSSPAPPHSSSSPTPLSSSDLHWLYALIPLVIVVLGGVYFWKLRKKSNTADDEEEATETPAVSRSSVSKENNNWKNDCGGCVAVAMNGCGENAEALLAS
ncbi:unnamed protein product [Leuciscus chuanchicus]